MSRYTPAGTVSTLAGLNSELESVSEAFEDTLSRKGDSPNQMEVDLDMNGNSVLNVTTDPNNAKSLVVREDIYLREEVDNLDDATLDAAKSYANSLAFPEGTSGIDYVTFEQFGGIANADDNTDAIETTLEYCETNNIRKIYASAGTWRARYINKTFKYLTIEGAGSGRPGTSNDGGTRLAFIGTGEDFIKNGADDSQPWDANLYDGPQGLTLRNINVYNESSTRTTQLECTKVSGIDDAFYSPNTIAVRDWRGGHIYFQNVFIEGFDYSFWGVNSDFNVFGSFTQAYCKRGIYLGPRSDQSYSDGMYSFLCDSTGIIDKSSNHRFHNYQSVLCGSTVDFGFRVTKGSSNIKFYEPWLENYSGVIDCLEFFDIGTLDGYNSDTTATLDVHVINPLVAVQTSGDSGPNEIVRVRNGERIVITEVTGARGTTVSSNVSNYFHIPAGVTSTGMDLLYKGSIGTLGKVLLNNGTGVPNLAVEENGNQWSLSSQTGRLSIGNIQGAAGADELRITQNNGVGRVSIEAPQKPSGQTRRLDLFKSIVDKESMPTSGEYETGDYARNINTTLDGNDGSKYVILGWIRITDGSSHVLGTDWVEDIAYVQNPLDTDSQWTLRSTTGRVAVIDTNGAAGADMFIMSMENIVGRLRFEIPNMPSGQTTRLSFQRVFTDVDAKPTSGSWVAGDYARLTTPTIHGTGTSQYVLKGWIRITTGSGHVLDTDWVEDRGLTGGGATPS